jgi:hypothetical protein
LAKNGRDRLPDELRRRNHAQNAVSTYLHAVEEFPSVLRMRSSANFL